MGLPLGRQAKGAEVRGLYRVQGRHLCIGGISDLVSSPTRIDNVINGNRKRIHSEKMEWILALILARITLPVSMSHETV